MTNLRGAFLFITLSFKLYRGLKSHVIGGRGLLSDNCGRINGLCPGVTQETTPLAVSVDGMLAVSI